MSRFRYRSALLLVFAALSVGAHGQQEPSEPPEAREGFFVDVLDVAVVDVDVYVTDKKGNRITGLTRDDFEIEEDGRPVAITNFYAIENGRRLQPEGEPVVAVEVPQGPVPQEAVSRPDDEKLNLIVYIDNFNIRPFQRNRVMRELRQFLREKLSPGDRIMLVSYDRSLNIRRHFTTDPQLIASALLDLETVSGHAVHRESDRQDALERIDESQSVSEAVSFARTYAGSLFNDLSFSISHLRDFIDQLEGMPGRKAILYVSEGLPMIAGEDLFHAIENKFGSTTAITQALEYDASRRFRELAAAANANRVSFYTIDAGGLRTFTYMDASRSTAGQGAFVDQIYFSNLQNPLQFLAEETGGRAILNTNRVSGPLEEVAADFNSYYSLGYSPATFGDGRYHRIKVKVKDRKGLRVRHRLGYRSKPSEQRMADGTRSLLMHRTESNPLGVQIGFGDQQPAEKGNFMVPLMVSIPIDKVVLVPAEGSHQARLRLFVAVMDADGGMSEVQSESVPITIPDDELERAREQSYLYGVRLLMRRGLHEVAIGLRDEVAAEESFVHSRVTVGG